MLPRFHCASTSLDGGREGKEKKGKPQRKDGKGIVDMGKRTVGSIALQMLLHLDLARLAVLHGNYHHDLTAPLSNQIAWLKLPTV